jgi:hypothetical protein
MLYHDSVSRFPISNAAGAMSSENRRRFRPGLFEPTATPVTVPIKILGAGTETVAELRDFVQTVRHSDNPTRRNPCGSGSLGRPNYA